MALGFVGSLRMYPLDWSASRWAWTVDGEANPTASAISRTLGGYPRSSTVDRMNSRIRFCLGPSASTPAMVGTSPPLVGVRRNVARTSDQSKHQFARTCVLSGRYKYR